MIYRPWCEGGAGGTSGRDRCLAAPLVLLLNLWLAIGLRPVTTPSREVAGTAVRAFRSADALSDDVQVYGGSGIPAPPEAFT